MSVVLSEHLSLLATAPDGIQKLRGLILGLAVRGKLVPQDPNDEPARALLGRIAQERARIEGTKTRKTNDQNSVGDRIPLFGLPESWAWVGFGEIALHNAGKTLDKGRNSGQPRDYITTSNLYWGRFELGDLKQMLIGNDEMDRCTARKNDLLICEGGEAGRAAVWPYERVVCFQNHIHRARFFGGIDPYFGYYFFEWLNASGEIDHYRKGVGISNMSGKALASIPFTLPPLEEQYRIVAKVSELMALCDRLEAEQADAESAQSKLVETLLNTLAQSTDAADFAASWQRLAEHFSTLFTTEASIDALKQTMLQLAVMGKLVPQQLDEEPALEILKRIEQERARDEAKGVSRKPKPLPTVCHNEQPYQLPKKWMWVPLGLIATIKGGKRVANGYQLSKTPTPFIYIRVSDMRNGSIDDNDLRYIDAHMHQAIKNYIIKKEDIYMTIVGATIGKCGLVPEQFDGMNLTENAARLIVSQEVDRNYLYRCLTSDFCQKQFSDKTKQVGVQKMALNRLASAAIPLPPLAEQRRIVAKFDELMALCDRLKADLAESRRHQERLASTLIESALKAA